MFLTQQGFVPKWGQERYCAESPKLAGISRKEDHLVSRPGAIQADGLKHKQPNSHLGTQKGFVEGTFPSMKCQNGCLCQAANLKGGICASSVGWVNAENKYVNLSWILSWIHWKIFFFFGAVNPRKEEWEKSPAKQYYFPTMWITFYKLCWQGKEIISFASHKCWCAGAHNVLCLVSL